MASSSVQGAAAHVRILVVEDSPLMRSATTSRLRNEPEMDVVGEASDRTQALSCIEERIPDVVLLDLRLGGSTQEGIDLAADIGRRFPTVRIVIYSAYFSAKHADLLGAPNIWGCVLKTEPPRSVVDAVRAVARGERYRTEWR